MEPGPLSASLRISRIPFLGTRILRDARSSPIFPDLAVGHRQPVPVRGHHPQHRSRFRLGPFEQDPGEVVPRFVGGGERHHALGKFPEGVAVDRYRLPRRLLRHLGKFLRGQPRKAEMGPARGDLDVVPILPGNRHHGFLRKHLGDVEQFAGRKGDRPGFARGDRLQAADHDFKIRRHHRQIPAADGHQRVGKDRHRVPSFGDSLDSGEHVDEQVSVHSKVHRLPLPVLRIEKTVVIAGGVHSVQYPAGTPRTGSRGCWGICAKRRRWKTRSVDSGPPFSFSTGYPSIFFRRMSSVFLKDTSSATFFSIFFTAYITVV